MIYQLTVYYGAMINDKVIYSTETTLTDCKCFPSKFDEAVFRKGVEAGIIRDGFSPSSFKLGYITKEQYENRETVGNETVSTIEIKARD